MSSIEDRVAELERCYGQLLVGQQDILGMLHDVKGDVHHVKEEVGTVSAHLGANGAVSVVVHQKRVKFTGSMPNKWFVGGSVGGVRGGGVGIGWLLGRVFGVW